MAALALALCACSTPTPEDGKIRDDLVARIRSHPALLGDHLNVRVIDHVAYVGGEISTMHEYFMVSDIAQKTPGVTKVVNDTHEPPQY